MTKTIYPLILEKNRGKRTELETYLRKEHQGKYYLWCIRKDFENPQEPWRWKEKICEVSCQIHIEAYFSLINGIIDPFLRAGFDHSLIFELDENQESESERLKKTLL